MHKKGLSTKDVLINRKTYGTNEIILHKKNQFISLLMLSLHDPIIKILLVALAIKVLFLFNDSNMYEIFGILASIILSSLISSLSEYGSEKAFNELLEESSKSKCFVFRNNKKEYVKIDDIVVKDILLLSEGEKVPADCIIIDGNITINESSLTGESDDKYKKINDKIYRGSVITDNTCCALVQQVGMNTKYGNLTKDITSSSPSSPLTLRLKKLAKTISTIGYIGALLVVISYLFNVIIIKNNFELEKVYNTIINAKIIFPHILYALTLGVTIIVVSVPEGCSQVR